MIRKRLLFSIAIASVILIQSSGTVTLAQSAGDIKLINPLGENATFIELLQHIFTEATKIIAVIVPIIVIIGAFQMMFARGEPEKFITGQKTILYAVIGFVVILMANGIVSIVKSLLTI